MSCPVPVGIPTTTLILQPTTTITLLYYTSLVFLSLSLSLSLFRSSFATFLRVESTARTYHCSSQCAHIWALAHVARSMNSTSFHGPTIDHTTIRVIFDRYGRAKCLSYFSGHESLPLDPFPLSLSLSLSLLLFCCLSSTGRRNRLELSDAAAHATRLHGIWIPRSNETKGKEKNKRKAWNRSVRCRQRYWIKGSFSCKRGFSFLNFERGLKKTMGCLILKLYVIIILY